MNNNGNQVSNLSNALRQVNIGNRNSNTTTDQSNINFEFPSGVNSNNSVQNSNNGRNGTQNNNNENSIKDTIEQHRQQQQAFSDMSHVEYSRITKFFQEQPLEGYTLFSHRSAPNGFKVAIVLSELGFHYNTIFLDFNLGEHRAPEFVSVNPNARVPALIDHNMDNLSIWESGAILPVSYTHL